MKTPASTHTITSHLSNSTAPPSTAPTTGELKSCGVCLENIEPTSANAVNFCPNGDHSLHNTCMNTYLEQCQAQNSLSTMPNCIVCRGEGQLTEGQIIEPSDAKETQRSKLLFAQNLNAWSHELFSGNNSMAIFELEDFEAHQRAAGLRFIDKSLNEVSTLPQAQRSIQLEKILASGIEAVLSHCPTEPTTDELDSVQIGDRIAMLSQTSSEACANLIEGALSSLDEKGMIDEERQTLINTQILQTNSFNLRRPGQSVNMDNAVRGVARLLEKRT